MPGIRDQDDLDLKEKFKAYEEQYAKYLLSKYFSNKNFYGANVFEEEVKIDDEVIKSSRFPCMESYADPLQAFLAKDIISGSGSASDHPVPGFPDKGKSVSGSETESQPDVNSFQAYLNKGKAVVDSDMAPQTTPFQVSSNKASGSGTSSHSVPVPLELDFFKTLDLNAEPVAYNNDDDNQASLKLDCNKIPDDDDSDTDPVEVLPHNNNNQMDTDQSGIYPDDRAPEDVELGPYAETIEALLELSRGAPSPSAGNTQDLSTKSPIF